MKILSITHNYRPTDGAAMMLTRVLRYWAQDLGWHVEALLFRADQQLEIDAGIGVVGLVQGVSQTDLKNYDVVLINSLLNLEWVSRVPLQVPVVLWAHEGATFWYHSGLKVSDWLKAFSQADALIFQTPWQPAAVYSSCLINTQAQRVQIIPNPVFMLEHGEGPIKAHPADRPFRIINVGSLYGRKRQNELLEAVQSIHEHHALAQGVQCTLVGEGQFMSTLGEGFEPLLQSSFVQWHGAITDTHALAQKLRDSDVFCFCSGDETFGLAPLEAASQGLPVILANLPVYAAIGWRDGENCLMYPLGDIQALRAAILRIAHDASLSQRLASAGQALARGFAATGFFNRISQLVQVVGQSTSTLRAPAK